LAFSRKNNAIIFFTKPFRNIIFQQDSNHVAFLHDLLHDS